ncbi:ankyrin repeat domain-containing protein 1-like [Coccinella septempunctata]|uniref:ankyrin repeat domain-containing protein 1-like n=1 Tax=Coccinella septempunctata TaxID=41139 RepID=UPI001D080575|nr:ankyrin repeat domain-containing protein 1-like [Coccinella septempunctata]
MLHGGNTALHIAVKRQMKDEVGYIIGRKPQINKKSDRLSTPLHEAVKCERDITQILLDNGADIEARDRTGQTPLHWALGYTNSLDQVRTLIINSADVDSMDEYARTPLHTLCSKGLRINFDTFELLLQKVSDINAGDMNGASPLHKLMRFLQVDSESEKEKLIDLFLQYGVNLNEQDHFSDSVPDKERRRYIHSEWIGRNIHKLYDSE